MKENTINKLLLIYIIKKTNEIGKLQGITKLQKLTYLVENNSNQNKIKSLNYEFIRWYYGPFSKNLYDNFDELMANKIIREENSISLGELGEKIFNLNKEIFEKNDSIMKNIDHILIRFSSLTTLDISSFVYGLETQIKGIKIRIKDVPLGALILKELIRD